jgi:stage II sporulation protein D
MNPRAGRSRHGGRHLALAVAALLGLHSCATVPPGGAPPPAAPGTPSRPGAARPPEPEAGEPNLTIGLAWDLDTLILDPVGAARAEVRTQHRLEASQQLSVHLLRAGALVRAVGGRDSWSLTLDRGDTLWLSGTDGPEDGPARFVRWGGKSYRGSLKVFVNPRGRLTLATRLPLETYLRGVVPGEIGALAEDLLEAGRAQAIAARSYTLFYRGRRAAEGFDLYGTVEDQMYGPVESERPLADRVVRSTAGEVARSEGRPIRANYCSTCGGITADVWEAWPTAPLTYLVSHRDRTSGPDLCAASPSYRWREEWSPDELLRNLQTYGPGQGVATPAGGLGELLDVRVAQRSRSGRVWRLEVVTSRGSITIPAYGIRQVLRRGGNPSAILRSNLFKVEVRRDPRNRRALAVVASGAGSGHGVGLCQVGALGLARRGADGEAILRTYYPGTKVERAY